MVDNKESNAEQSVIYADETYLEDDIQKPIKISSYNRKIKTLDLAAMLLSMSGLVITYYENDYSYFGSISEDEVALLRISVIFLTVLLDCCLIIRAKLMLRVKILNKSVSKNRSLWRPKFILELLLNSVCAPPLLDFSISGTMNSGTYKYTLSDLVLLVMAFRLYILSRLYREYSKWFNSNSAFLPLFAKKLSKSFHIRSDILTRTIPILFVYILVYLLLSGILVKVLERSFVNSSSVQGLEYLSNVEWLLTITMTTVGYGDYYPSTYLGRFVCACVCLLGMGLVSMLFIWLANLTTLSANETLAFLNLKVSAADEKVIKSAMYVIICSLQHSKKSSIVEKLKSNMELRHKSHAFYKDTIALKLIKLDIEARIYDFHYTIQDYLNKVKAVIQLLPTFEPRIIRLKNRQSILSQKLRRAWEQQKTIDSMVQGKKL